MKVTLNEAQLKEMISESVKGVIKEWNGWHRTLTPERAVQELRNAWRHYCEEGLTSLTSDDEAFVESLIDTIEQ